MFDHTHTDISAVIGVLAAIIAANSLMIAVLFITKRGR